VTACLQIPDFPAWAFARDSAPFAPLIVVERERVVAATGGARRRGVEAGLPVERARTLAPAAEVRVRDGGLEEAVWEDVLSELNRHTPRLEPIRPGRAFLSAPLPTLKAMAERFGAPIGVGPERATARLAAARTNPGHVLAIDEARRRPFLNRYDINRLPSLGFSEEIAERLRLFGYPTLGAITILSRRQLDAQFAEEGAALYNLLHPAPESPIPMYQPLPTLTAEVDFDLPCREPGELMPALEPLAEEVARELRQVAARRVSVVVEVRGGLPRRATRILFEAATEPRRVLSAARPLLMEVLDGGAEVERLAIELGALRPVTAGQGALFRERPSAYMAARGVHRRFPGAIKRAVVVYAQFPEDRVQFEPFVDLKHRRAA